MARPTAATSCCPVSEPSTTAPPGSGTATAVTGVVPAASAGTDAAAARSTYAAGRPSGDRMTTSSAPAAAASAAGVRERLGVPDRDARRPTEADGDQADGLWVRPPRTAAEAPDQRNAPMSAAQTTS